MSEQNKATSQAFAEVDKGNLDAVEELWPPDHVFHTPGSPAMDATAHRQLLQMYREAFGDWRQEITSMVDEDDHVVTAFVFHGTHTGEPGFPRSAPRLRWRPWRSLGSARDVSLKSGPFSTGWACCSNSARSPYPRRLDS
jgi:predicted ester cyclase